MASFGSLKQAIFDRQTRKQQYQDHIRGLNAYDRHKKFLNDYVRFYGRERSTQEKLPVKTDQDTLKEGYRFIRTEEDDMNPSWETHYKSGKIGLRWRTEKEVTSGKGHFVCGNKHCNERDGLASYEVNFSYVEAEENKQALVKLVACERCAEKLLYKKRKEKDQSREDLKDKHRRRRGRSASDDEHKDDYYERRRRGRSVSDDENKDDNYKRRKRERSVSDDDTKGDNYKRRKGRSRGSKAPTSSDNQDNENMDEYLEGMFP
uniref:Protein FRA10AC1 n=1 Tax=Solanum lycopersicum TaxID=4081 RepID=A0A3Q7G8L7_SOLLC